MLLKKSIQRRRYFRGPSFVFALMLHVGAIFLIVYLPSVLSEDVPAATEDAYIPPETIYYVPVHREQPVLPRVAPAGPGARPMNGSVPGLPAKGSTSQNVITIASNPARPDNKRQTIIQPDTPPELKIKDDLKLPNLIMVKPVNAPKMQFDANASKPSPINRKADPDAPPSPAPVNPAVPVMTVVAPVSAPQLLMPVPSASGIVSRSANNTTSATAEAPTLGANADGSSVLVLVVDPSDPGAKVTLPPGSRSGEFSVSSGVGAGSPGGVDVGTANAGSRGHGTGGDGSLGIGLGTSGGGGGKSGSSVGVYTSGGAPSGGALGPNLALRMVYPVPAAVITKLRKNALIVSAGPNGGGGLDVYGAMHCGKIYTIFLPMPRKNWTMQYCRVPDPNELANQAAEVNSNSTVVRLGDGLVPPQADSQFDFERLPVPPDKIYKKMIILMGMIKEDGTPDNIRVYQSILPEMDEAARTAMSRWKFKPAMREGKPVAVEILVGIPVDAVPPPASDADTQVHSASQ